MRQEEMDFDQSEELEIARLPSAVPAEEILDTVTWRVSIPLSQGHFSQAMRQLREIYGELHGEGSIDPLDDPISYWLDDDRLCGHLNKIGVFTMLELMERKPVDYLRFDQFSESSVRKIAQIQASCRERLGLLDNYRLSVRMSE